MNEAVDCGPKGLQQIIAALLTAFAADDHVRLNVFVAGSGAQFAQQQIAIVKIFGSRFDEQIGQVRVQERFCEDRGGNGHADVKKDVVEVLSAMLDQVCQTRRIFRRIGKFKPQERRATAASLDLSSQPKFAIEAGIQRAPIAQGQAAFALHALNEQNGAAAFAAKRFGKNLRDEFVRDATGKAHQTDDAVRVRCKNCATMRIDSGQSPAIPFWGRHISQSIHFRCLAFGGCSR